MMSREKLTGKRLREVVNYDAATGIFTWVESAIGRWKHEVGDVCGTITRGGYRRLHIDGRDYQANQLAWFWVHGEMPTRNVWFKDENRDNAAINNLAYGATDRADVSSMNAYQRKWRASRPVQEHARRIKRNYGVTLEQYREMLLAQGGCCAICEKPETAAQQGKVIPLSVDHDHSDGSVRSLLCRVCNAMLGQSKDRPDILRKAADYLEAHAAKPKTNVIPLAARRLSNKGD